MALEASYPLVVVHGTARPGRAAWAELVSVATAVVIPVRDDGEAMAAVRATLRSLQQLSDAASDLAAAAVVVALPGLVADGSRQSPPPAAPPDGMVTVRCGTPDPTTRLTARLGPCCCRGRRVSCYVPYIPGSSGGPRC